MNNGIKTFIGESMYSLKTAIIDADTQANTWLATHKWMDTNGQSAYVLTAETVQAMRDGDGWTYIMHLLGPMDETP